MSQNAAQPLDERSSVDPGSSRGSAGEAGSGQPEFDLGATPLRPGVTLIEAGAGTGKTYTLVGLVLRLVLEEEVRLPRILLVTFTRAAASELREKVRDALASARLALQREEPDLPGLPDFLKQRLARPSADRQVWLKRLETALYEFDEARIRTIHGFCQTVLQEQAFETGAPFDAEPASDPAELGEEVARDFWRRHFYNLDPLVARVLFSRQLVYKKGKKDGSVDAGFEFETLRRLIRAWGRHPDAEIPPAPGADSLEDAVARLRAAWQTFRERAHEHREAVEDGLLVNCKWGNKPYGPSQKAHNQQRLAELWRALETPVEDLSGRDFEMIHHFSQRNIEARVSARSKKNPPSPPRNAFFEAADALLRARREAVGAIKRVFLRFAAREMEERAEEYNLLTYDKMLSDVAAALRDEAGRERVVKALRARYRAALIDEFQDTDSLQYGIFQRIFQSPGCRLILVGDPKQSIYRFRGADIHTYLRAARDVDYRYTLKKNYRSEARLLEGLNRLFSRPVLPFGQEEVSYEPVRSGLDEGSPRLTLRDDPHPALLRLGIWANEEKANKDAMEDMAHRWAVEEILRLVRGRARFGERALSWGDIAILAPKRYYLAAIQERLAALGVPATLRAGGSVWHTREARELERVMRAVRDLRREDALRGALTTPLFAYDATGIDHLLRDEMAWEEVLAEFREYQQIWLQRGFIQMFTHILDRRGVRERLARLTTGLRQLTNYQHLAELLHEYARAENTGQLGLIKFLAEKQANPVTNDDPEAGDRPRMDRDDPAVTLMTLHGSKGLQWPVVLCPFLWDDALSGNSQHPEAFYYDHQRQKFAWILDDEIPEDHRAGMEADQLSEQMRLIYVALTRARHQCGVFWGKFQSSQGIYGRCLSYLLHQEQEQAGPGAGEAGDCLKLLEQSSTRYAGLTAEDLARDLRDALETRAADGATPAAVELWEPADELPRLLRLPEPAEEEEEGGETAGSPRDAPLTARTFTGRISRDWAVSSFTALKRRAKNGHGSTGSLPALDDAEQPGLEDAADAADAALPELGETGSVEHLEPAEETGTGRGADIFAFPAGARTGTFFHEVLENVDFTDSRQWEPVIREALRRANFERETLLPPVQRLLRDLARTALPATGEEGQDEDYLELRQIAPQKCRAEMEFALPLRDVHLPRLVKIFQRDPRHAPDWWVRFQEKLASLPVTRLKGYLRGFIDLVFEHEGRFYLIDWKSNYLGGRKSDFQPGKLPRAMVDDLYILQYYLYTVALWLYLEQRLDDFDYDTHFGGVYYIFLRGLESANPGNGVFFDRPPRQRVAELVELLSGSDT